MLKIFSFGKREHVPTAPQSPPRARRPPVPQGVLAVLCLLCLEVVAAPADARSRLKCVQEELGVVSAVQGVGHPMRRVRLQLPEPGIEYRVRVAFLKAEEANGLIHLFAQGNPGQSSAAPPKSYWTFLRQLLEVEEVVIDQLDSKASLIVRGPEGQIVDQVSNLNLVPYFRAARFHYDGGQYTAEIECARGAGLFRLEVLRR